MVCSTTNPIVVVVRAIIEMAHEPRVDVVAEGVETTTEAWFPHGFGCKEIQGFLFSKAVPVEGMTELLRTRNRFQVVESPGLVTAVA